MNTLLLNFLSYFGVGILLFLLGIFFFSFTTKIKEFELMGKGNKAASYMFSGKLVGMSIVLYSAISNSVNLIDLVTWGFIAITVQILAYFVAEWATPKFNINQAIEDGNESIGFFLFALSLSIGLIIAACLTY